MTIMTTGQFKSVVEPVMNSIFNGLYKKLEPEWSQIFSSETALARSFQSEVLLAGLGIAVEKGQGAPVTYDSGGEDGRQDFLHITYALAFQLTEELIEDGDHIRIGSLYSQHLARGMNEAAEIVHANVLNRAQTSGYTWYDGKTLFATDHPLFGGGTYSNRLTTATDLSEAGLEDTVIMMRKAVDSRGKKFALKPRDLVIAPDNIFEAERIINSMSRVGTANNDANALRNMGIFPRSPKVMTRLTNARAWYVITDIPKGLVHYTRAKMETMSMGEFETGNLRYRARERYSCGVVDPRGVYGSIGT